MNDQVIKVYVRPGSSVDCVDGWYGEHIKIRLSKPPQKGKANQALIGLIASKLNLPTQNVAIISGNKSNYKKILIKTPHRSDIISKLLNS
ncbi:MAG: DUF167 domain-containing protein [Actinomycetia bacterium]|nr:DUF167 domain-containing protein [Actinomycetes bacterium]